MHLAPVLVRAAASALFVAWGVPTAEPTRVNPLSAAGPEQVVTYAGVSVRVPAAWPVYDLAAAPETCVRYDVNAVYLGDPGPDQDCPASAVGRVETVSITPAAVPRAREAGDAAFDNAALSSADPGADSSSAEPVLSRQVGAMRVDASYADDDSEAAAILATARAVDGGPAGPAAASATVTGAVSGTVTGDVSGTAALSLAGPQAATPSPPPKVAATFTGKGFDSCAAPSLATMTAWMKSSPFRAAGIYIGGSDRACPDGNLTPTWVRKVGAMGWRMFPIYVGRQASCWQDPGGPKSKAPRILHSARWTEGVQAADDAANRAKYFGLAPGSIVYFDMEYYPHAVKQCSQDVQAFLNAWTDELHRRGFLSGIYSSALGAVADMAHIYTSLSAYRADAVWFAHWDSKGSTTGDPTLSDKLWPGRRRIKQYVGGHDATYGGRKLNIDTDVLNGPVAALVSAKPAARPGLKQPVPQSRG